MFDSNPLPQDPLADVDQLAPDFSTIESVIAASTLPAAAKNGQVSQVFERLMDEREIARLTESVADQVNSAHTEERLAARKTALTAALATYLTCAVIRLPGLTYTVEIDLAKGTIVHWEWLQL